MRNRAPHIGRVHVMMRSVEAGESRLQRRASFELVGGALV